MDLKEIKRRDECVGTFMTRWGIFMPLWYGLEYVKAEYTKHIQYLIVGVVCSIELIWILTGWIWWLPVMIICTIYHVYLDELFKIEYMNQWCEQWVE